MSARDESLKKLFDRDEVESVLRGAFYAREPEPTTVRSTRPKAEHYEVICISLYKEDLEALDAKVTELKKRGHRRVSRSSLIRYAVAGLDLGAIPRSVG
jgi:hypothetical protein